MQTILREHEDAARARTVEDIHQMQVQAAAQRTQIDDLSSKIDSVLDKLTKGE
jgi:hypothetical protein